MPTTAVHIPRLSVGMAVTAAAALALLVVPNDYASADEHEMQGSPRGVVIAPARVEQDLEDVVFFTRVHVVNNDPGRREIEISAVGLDHDHEGNLSFNEEFVPSGVLTMSPSSFVLDPGDRQIVDVEVQLPDRQSSLYAGIAVTFHNPDVAGAVVMRGRLVSTLLLRGPGPWNAGVEVRDAGLVPGEDQEPGLVVVDVANTGDVHVRPHGHVRILHDGDEVGVTRLDSELILPGSTRRFAGMWPVADRLEGEVTLVVELFDPAASFTKVISAGEVQMLAPPPGMSGTNRWAVLAIVLLLAAALVALARAGREIMRESARSRTLAHRSQAAAPSSVEPADSATEREPTLVS